MEDLFHDGMQFSLAQFGYPNLELKKDVLERYAWTKICAEHVTNGLCCQVSSQAPQAENTWCMRQFVYIENCMGKSPIVKKLCK